MEEGITMTEAEIKKNPCGDDKEIDEYLDGTICEVAHPDEEINDIDAPADDEYEVEEKADPEKLTDEYMNEK
jgi:hypothetical protein